MNIIENLAMKIRHSHALKEASWLWNAVRPCYEAVIGWIGRKGLSRNINGSDLTLITPRYRYLSEVYEPEVWRNVMKNLRPDDVFADVGAYIGLYAIACAKRMGPAGKTFLFEPDPENMKAAKEHARLNGVLERIVFNDCFVSAEKGSVKFMTGSSSLSRAADLPLSGGSFGNASRKEEERIIETITLDDVFSDQAVDILKIDVEGYEEKVLTGARLLMSDPERCPRLIFIEVHPFAWEVPGTTSGTLLALLNQAGYSVFGMDGTEVKKIENYGEIAALKQACRSSAGKTPVVNLD